MYLSHILKYFQFTDNTQNTINLMCITRSKYYNVDTHIL